jgi:arabinofuranan 3-O-arabinosyltransferase
VSDGQPTTQAPLAAPALRRGERRRTPRLQLRRVRTTFTFLRSLPPTVLAYGLPAVVGAAAVQMWFRGETVLASGDLPPPTSPGTEYRAHWNQFEAGEGAPTFAIVGLPYFEGLRVFDWLGLSEAAFQRLWLTLLVVGAVTAVVYLARALVDSPLAVAVAGLIALLNGYRLATGFDPVPLAAMIAAGFLGGLVIRAGGERGPRPLVFALVSMLLGFVLANPPLAMLVGAWVAASAVLAWAVHGQQAPRRVAAFILAAAPLAVVFNLWWAVPALQTLTTDLFGERFAAAGIDAWAWTHARASLPNVVGLTSNWGWPQPEYFPFSAGLERAPLSLLQYVPATAAAVGLLLAGRRYGRTASVLALFGLASIWVMKGLHAPFGGTNRWSYDNVPGFWLLRDPAKAGLVLVLLFSLLAAIAIARLASIGRWLGAVAAIVVVGGAAVYAHPLLSGAIVPDDRPLLPSAHIHVPAGWREAAAYLEAQPDAGKIVALPQLDYYQVPTTWGYYGSSFLHQLIDRPVVEVLPGGYYRSPAVSALVTSLQTRIRDGSRPVESLLEALGARYVLLRRDLDISFPDRSFADPGVLARGLDRVPDLRRVQSFGLVDLYEAASLRAPEVYAAVPVVYRGNGPGNARQILQDDAQIALVPSAAASAVRGLESGEVRVRSIRTLSRGVRIQPRPTGIIVRLAPAAGIAAEAVRFPAVEPPFRVVVGGQNVVVKGALDSVALKRSDRSVLPGRSLLTKRLEFSDDVIRRLGDCNRYDARSLRAAGISAHVDRRPPETLRLQAREHSACVALPIERPSGNRGFRLRLAYRGVRGNTPRVCVWQEAFDECAPLSALDGSPGWHRLEATVRPRTGTASLHLFLYADGGGGLTVTEYRRPVIEPIAPPLAVAVVPIVRLPRISYRRVSPAEFRIHVSRARRPFLLVATETFASGWRVESPGRDARGVTHVRVNGYANGWRIPWAGSYDLTIRYGPERLAKLARRLDLVAVPLGILALFWWPRSLRRPRAATPDRRRRRAR